MFYVTQPVNPYFNCTAILATKKDTSPQLVPQKLNEKKLHKLINKKQEKYK